MPKSWKLRGEREVRITRDASGVLHVRAATEPDLYRGLGFCHAHDRSLSLLLARILGRGRACELLHDNEHSLDLDRFFRRLNLAEEAQAEVARCPQETARCLAAYCHGVNAALDGRGPWELRLLGYRLEKWTPADTILMSRLAAYVGLAQSQGDMEHVLIEMVQAGVQRAHLEELFPGKLGELDENLVRRINTPTRVIPPALAWEAGLPRAIASNNWVLAPHKTASGHAVLANDPHLEGNRLPSVWYEAVLEQGEWWCVCATMPGLPFPAVARTKDLAWGVTYACMDSIDSWIEDCRDGCYRRTEKGHDRWEPFRIRREAIERRTHGDVEAIFYENDHGTLDGDPNVPGLYLATRWASGRGTGARSLDASRRLLRTTEVGAAMDLIGQVESAWNWVLADSAGNIGYQMSGLMPRRRPGANGLVPLPGWKSENDWKGFVPVDELPRELNPERGFIATANEDRNHLGKVAPITIPMGSERADRIAALLSARDDWDAGAVQSMQMDAYSSQAERFLEVLEPLLPDSEAARALRDWDRCYTPGSRGALLFERLYRALIQEVLGSVCGRDVAGYMIEETAITAMLYASIDRILLDQSSAWYLGKGRDRVLAEVAQRVLSDPVDAPGEARRVVMQHLLWGGRLPRWLGFDYGPIEVRGSRATIHQGQIFRYNGRETTFMPSYRMVTDFSESTVHSCLLGGPSDRRFSHWYTAGIDDWLQGRFKALAPTEPPRENPPPGRGGGLTTWASSRDSTT